MSRDSHARIWCMNQMRAWKNACKEVFAEDFVYLQTIKR